MVILLESIKFMEHRINYIDRAKGCTIFCVVMGHVYHISLRNYYGFFVEMIYSFHMFLFFFLSGLVSVRGISFPYWSYGKLMSKIYGLIVPMLLFGFFYVFLENVHDFRIEYIWNKFLLNTLKHGYWYLFVLSIFYLSLVLYRINRKDKFLIHAFISVALWGRLSENYSHIG